MKLTKNIISRDEALKLAPDYVAYNEAKVGGNYDLFDKMIKAFESMKRGKACITFHDGQYFKCKVTEFNENDMRADDGPFVRVSNGEYSWRCDGDRYAYPIK